MLFGSVTAPPNQKVGPVADTGKAPPVGSTTVQVNSFAEPGRLEKGSSSGSSWPVQPESYFTSKIPSMYFGRCAMHPDWFDCAHSGAESAVREKSAASNMPNKIVRCMIVLLLEATGDSVRGGLGRNRKSGINYAAKDSFSTTCDFCEHAGWKIKIKESRQRCRERAGSIFG